VVRDTGARVRKEVATVIITRNIADPGRLFGAPGTLRPRGVCAPTVPIQN